MGRATQSALCLVFFLSGASALLFESLWFQLASLALGNSVWASALVLSSFMAGLALGSLLVGKLGRRFERPLRVYALLEVVIGITGYGLVLLLPRMSSLLVGLYQPLLDDAWALNALRLGVAFVLLLVPSTAMGATLPLLVRTLTRTEDDFGYVLGRLYGWNTFGGVAGALAGELLFIGTLGLRGTGLVAAGLNFAAAGAVAAIVVRGSRGSAADSARTSRMRDLLQPAVVRLLLGSFLAGAILLGFEVVWFRFMLLFRNSTSFVFTLLLSVVLAGIALGGLVASSWLRARPSAYRFLPFVALTNGIVICLTYSRLTEWMDLLSALPASALSAILFIFIGRALEDELFDETLAAASLTFANTAGSMAGSLVAGFLLLPSLGVEGSFFALALAYVLVAFFVLHGGEERAPRAAGESRWLRAVALAASLVLALFPFGRMNGHFLPRVLAPYTTDGSALVGAREGLTETAFYLRKDFFGDARYHRLVTNGFSMSATNLRSRRYMRLFAYWPLAIRPEAKRALLISYGVGLTAQALTETDSLESIDIVDISSNVVELSREVEALTGEHPLDDPRVRVHIEDGRFFLLASPKRFDIITAEPPPPRNAGIASLYSVEYFSLLRDRLEPGGVATYWLPVYQLAVEESRAVAGAFCDAFEDCTLWTGAGTDWMLAGTNGLDRRVSDEAFARQWERPLVAERLRAIGLERPEQLGALFLGDSPFLKRWVGDTPALEDNYPHRIQDRTIYHDWDNSRNPELLRVMEATESGRRFESSEWVRSVWPAAMRERTLPYFAVQDLANRTLAMQSAGVPDLYAALTGTDLRSLSLILLGSDVEEWPTLERASRAGVDEPMLHYLLAAHALSRRDYPTSITELDRALELDPGSEELARIRILSCLLAGDQGRARRLSVELRASERSPNPPFWAWLESTLGPPPPGGSRN